MSEFQSAAHMPPPPESLSEEARAAVAAMMATVFPDTIDMATMRFFAEQMQTILGAEQQKRHDVTITDDVIGGVPVRRIVRASGKIDRSKVLINVHGGGFATDSGSLTENIPIAAMSGIEVIAALYRFAPEHPFPAAVDDALAVYRAALEGHEPRNIGVYGTSAGAVIGPQLLMRLKAEGLPLPGALGVFSGEPDMVGTADSLRIFADSFQGNLLVDAKWAYVGETDPRDPLISPIYGDLSGFPPTLCMSSGRDVLLSGTVNLHRALTDADVTADLVVYDGLPHAFWATMLAPECDDAFKRMTRFFAKRLGG
jgi:acetyl esterase/lipase